MVLLEKGDFLSNIPSRSGWFNFLEVALRKMVVRYNMFKVMQTWP
jgi:hypothetical protein